LNAVMTYVQSRERLIQQLAGGWGILGGLQVRSMGGNSVNLLEDWEIEPFISGVMLNPQIDTGRMVQVTQGTAIDSAGQVLSAQLAEPLDLQRAGDLLGATQRTASCAEWLGPRFCGDINLGELTAAEFWLVAEYTETPSRPMPALTGGGQCATGAQCDFTRKQPGMKLSVVKDLPLGFFLHGCLDAPNIPQLEAFIQLIMGGGDGDGGGGGGGPSLLEGSGLTAFSPTNRNTGANNAMTSLFDCLSYRTVPQLYEFLANISFNACCNRPAVALGRVLLVSQSDEFRERLGDSPYYVLIDQGYPYRRAVPSSAAFEMLQVLEQASCEEGGDS